MGVEGFLIGKAIADNIAQEVFIYPVESSVAGITNRHWMEIASYNEYLSTSTPL